MPESALGVLLKKMREQRGLSFRELGRLAELDHAYIYRLEAGDKDDPSTEALGKLTRALKAGKRESDMLQFLTQNPKTPVPLVELAMQDPTISFDHFTGAAGIAFRGKKPDFPTIIARLKKWEEEDAGG